VAKQRAAGILAAWGDAREAPVVDVVMPNLFGEHGRPHYNSVVATFCHLIAAGQEPTVVDDKELPLLHAQAMADILLDQAANPTPGRVRVPGRPILVSEMLAQLRRIAQDYGSGILPDLSVEFTRDLFNTYRSATFPQGWPFHPTQHIDPRGSLVEAVKGAGGQTQVFYSTTNPGYTRGQHWHRRKVERFMVLSGQADITLRRLFTDEVVTFQVTGEMPAIVDMPTMWAHAITNTGTGQLVTLFHADEVFDPARPDTIPEPVTR
jgi:UDP-2-acetamido-2,6-beta-L-arabino-hexul-4-ose reductase